MQPSQLDGVPPEENFLCLMTTLKSTWQMVSASSFIRAAWAGPQLSSNILERAGQQETCLIWNNSKYFLLWSSGKKKKVTARRITKEIQIFMSHSAILCVKQARENEKLALQFMKIFFRHSIYMCVLQKTGPQCLPRQIAQLCLCRGLNTCPPDQELGSSNQRASQLVEIVSDLGLYRVPSSSPGSSTFSQIVKFCPCRGLNSCPPDQE